MLEIVFDTEAFRLAEPAPYVNLVVRDHAGLVHIVVLSALKEERLVEAVEVDPCSLAIEDLASFQVVVGERSRSPSM